MMLTVVVLLLSLQVSYGDIETCTDDYPFEVCNWDIRKEYVPFNGPSLQKLCTKILDYYCCIEENAELFTPERYQYCGYPWILKKSESLIREVCKPGTRLNTEFVEQAPCYSHVQLFKKECEEFGETLFQLYLQREKHKKHAQNLKNCLSGTQFIHSIGRRINDTCGEGGYDLFHQLIKRSQFFVLFCSSRAEFGSALEAASDVLFGIMTGEIQNIKPKLPSQNPACDEKPKRKSLFLNLE